MNLRGFLEGPEDSADCLLSPVLGSGNEVAVPAASLPISRAAKSSLMLIGDVED